MKETRWGVLPEMSKAVDFLEENGFEAKSISFQTGGGEDEDSDTIWVKDDRAIIYDYPHKRWLSCKYSSINYIIGFDYDNSEVYNINA